MSCQKMSIQPLRRKGFRRCQSNHYDQLSSFQILWQVSCNRALSGQCATLLESHILFLSRLLKDSLLTHRLNQAMGVLVGLTGRCDKVPELLYIAGMEVLKNLPSGHTHRVQFYKNMILACPAHKQEILVDFALYLIQSQQDVTEALELLKLTASKINFAENLLLKAYLAQLEYLCWQPAVQGGFPKIQQDFIQSDDDHDDVFGQKNVTTMDYSAQHAMNLFEDVFSEPGVWDMFVPAYLHLIEHYQGPSCAKDFLEKYRSINNTNPNAHRYLYHFLKRNLASSQELVPVLEDILAFDPTSELLGEFAALQAETGYTETLVEAIFQKLDHAVSMGDEETWKLLEMFVLKKSKGNVHIKRVLRSAWTQREHWWPQYHFHLPGPNNILEKQNALLAKANVAEYFLQTNEFSTKARSLCKQGTDRETSTDRDNLSETGKQTRRKRRHRTMDEVVHLKRTKY